MLTLSKGISGRVMGKEMSVAGLGSGAVIKEM